MSNGTKAYGDPIRFYSPKCDSSFFDSQETKAAAPVQGQTKKDGGDSERIKDLNDHLADLRERLKMAENKLAQEKQTSGSLLALLEKSKDSNSNDDIKRSAEFKAMEEYNKSLHAKLEVSAYCALAKTITFAC